MIGVSARSQQRSKLKFFGHSSQRETNENTNDIIRGTWPKKMSLRSLTEADITTMEL